MDTIQVTLLLPVKNGEHYLQAAFASLKANAKPSYEVLIIDDNSEDETYFQLMKLCSETSNFRVLRNPGSGLVDALNFGISEARNEWIARFDVDDSYSERRLESQVAQVDENTVAVFADYSFQDINGKYLGKILSAVIPFATELSIVSAQRIAHPVALLNKSAVVRAGGYLHSEFPAEDLGLWLRMMKLGSFKSSPEILLNYRMSGVSITGSKRTLMLEARDKLLHAPMQLKSTIELLDPTITSVFSMYRKQNFYWERTLFFIRDLLIAKKMHLLNSRQKASTYAAFLIFLLNPFGVYLILKHAYYQNLRARVRKISFPNPIL